MTYRLYRPYSNGVLGVLKATWTLKLLSPLTIRNQNYSAFKHSEGGKGRGANKENFEFEWVTPDAKLSKAGAPPSNFSQISDFNYEFAVDGNTVKPEYSIPASSIRGTLRNAAIKRLVKFDERKLFSIPSKQDRENQENAPLPEQFERAITILNERTENWFHILSLFGNVYDYDSDQNDPITWAGRMKMNITIPQTGAHQSIECLNQLVESHNAPYNVRMQTAVRNPLDRATMGAKDKGLHSWLEMSENEQFTIEMRILNPTNTDIKLVNMWHTDIDDGFISFGALTQQGRGKCKSVEENYYLYVSRSSCLYDSVKDLQTNDAFKDDNIFQGIWHGAKLSRNDLLNLDISKLAQIKEYENVA